MYNFNEFCRSKKCPHYIVYETQCRACHTCDLYGFTFDVTRYPDTCIHLADVKIAKAEAKKKYLMWKKLNKIEKEKDNDITEKVF